MAMPELIKPFTNALISMGRVINCRVAPTICIVLIKKRLLNMASLMVLSILMITMTQRITAITSRAIPKTLVFSFSVFTSEVGNVMSAIWSGKAVVSRLLILRGCLCLHNLQLHKSQCFRVAGYNQEFYPSLRCLLCSRQSFAFSLSMY